MRAVWGNKKLRFALLGVAVAVLVGLVWCVWSERPPNLTLRLKILRTGFYLGEPAVLLHVAGAEQYEVHLTGFRYLVGDKASMPDMSDPPFSLYSLSPATEFWAPAPSQYSADLGNQDWKVQANVYVLASNKNGIGKAFRVIRQAWGVSRRPNLAFFSAAKAYWRGSYKYLVTEQTITSDTITNTPPH